MNPMTRTVGRIAVLVAAVASMSGPPVLAQDSAPIRLVEAGQGLDNWTAIGDANWRTEAGALVADRGKGGFLVSKGRYRDFELRAEVWCDDTTNSGVFIRAQDPGTINPQNAYEVNLFDLRPDPSYGTGAIVDVAKVSSAVKAGGRWNVLVISARGTRLSVSLNGTETVNVESDRHADGYVALQFGLPPDGMPVGAIKWRNVAIRRL